MKLLFDENLSFRLVAALTDSTVAETANVLRHQYIQIRHFIEDAEATFLPLHA